MELRKVPFSGYILELMLYGLYIYVELPNFIASYIIIKDENVDCSVKLVSTGKKSPSLKLFFAAFYFLRAKCNNLLLLAANMMRPNCPATS